jgi:peptidyl-prolyl cis-trans isomerase C
MKFNIYYSLASLVIILITSMNSAWSQSANVDLLDKPLASGIYGTVITVNDILSEVNKMPVNLRNEFFEKKENIQQIANNLMIRKALAVEAEKAQLDADPLVRSAIMVMIDRAMSDARLAHLDKINEPEEKALELYAQNLYKINSDKYEEAAQYKASHILIEKKESGLEKTKELIVQIKNGVNFSDLAKANSTDPGTAAKGGDLGTFGEGKMVKPFEDAVKALKKIGDVSEPVETQFGYHIIRLDGFKPKRKVTFDEVKNQLIEESRKSILSEKRVQKVQSIAKELVFENANIEELSLKGVQLYGRGEKLIKQSIQR